MCQRLARVSLVSEQGALHGASHPGSQPERPEGAHVPVPRIPLTPRPAAPGSLGRSVPGDPTSLLAVGAPPGCWGKALLFQAGITPGRLRDLGTGGLGALGAWGWGIFGPQQPPLPVLRPLWSPRTAGPWTEGPCGGGRPFRAPDQSDAPAMDTLLSEAPRTKGSAEPSSVDTGERRSWGPHSQDGPSLPNPLCLGQAPLSPQRTLKVSASDQLFPGGMPPLRFLQSHPFQKQIHELKHFDKQRSNVHRAQRIKKRNQKNLCLISFRVTKMNVLLRLINF